VIGFRLLHDLLRVEPCRWIASSGTDRHFAVPTVRALHELDHLRRGLIELAHRDVVSVVPVVVVDERLVGPGRDVHRIEVSEQGVHLVFEVGLPA